MKYLLLTTLLSLSSCVTCEFSVDESYQDNSEKKEIAEIDEMNEKDFYQSEEDTLEFNPHQLIIPH